MSLQDIQLKILLDVKGLSSVGSVNNALRGMHTAMDKTFKSSEALANSEKNQASGLAGLLAKVSQAEAKYDALYRASYRLKQAGDDLRDTGMAGINVLKRSAEVWGDYEFALNRAAGALLVNRNLYPQLSQGILEVAKNVRLYKPMEVAKATYYWASTTGQQVKTLKDLKVAMSGVTPILKAAALTETDFETAIKGVYSILVQYNKPLSATTDVTEKLMLVTQRTALEFPDLINSFKMLGPVARANGQTFEDIAQLLGMIGDAGIRGTMSGRALRQFFIQLVKPSAQAKKALNGVFKETFGLKNAYQKLVFPKGKFVGFAKYVKLLADVTKDMTQQERNNLLARTTTANSLPVMQAMLQREIDIRKGIIKATDAQKYSLKGAHKAFEESFGYLANSWKGLVGLLENSLMPIILQVGKTITEMAAPVVKKLSEIASALADWLQKNPQIVDFIVKVLAVGSVVLAAAGSILIFLGALMGIAAGIGFVIEAFASLFAPVVAFVALIAAFAVAVIKNTHGIRDAIVKFGKSFANFIRRLIGDGDEAKAKVGGLIDTLKKIGLIVLDNIVAALNWLSDTLDRLTPEQIETIKKIGLALLTMVAVNKALGMLATGLNAVSTGLNIVSGTLMLLKSGVGILSILPGGIGALSTALGGLRMAFIALNIALGPIGWAILAIGAAIAAFVLAYETNFMGFRDFVDGIVAWFGTTVLPAIQGFINAVGPIVTAVIAAIVGFFETVVKVVGDVVAFFSNLPENIGKFIDEVIANIKTFVGSVITTVSAFLTDLSENWAYYLGYILGRVIGFIASVIINVITFGVNLLTAVVDFLSKLPGRFAAWFGSVASTVYNWFATNIPIIASRAAALVNSIIDWVKKLPGRVADWFGSVLTTILNWFATNIPIIADKARKMVDDIITFVKALPGKAVDAIRKLPGMLADFIRTVPAKIASVVRDIGEGIIRGVWQGILSMADWLKSKVTGFFGGLIDGIKDSLGIHSPSRVTAEMGMYLIKGLAEGIRKTDDAYRAMRATTDGLISLAAAGSADVGMALNSQLAMAPANFSLRSDNTQTIRLEVQVTSPDGSVSQLDQQQLAQLINGGDLVRALEHMASVG